MPVPMRPPPITTTSLTALVAMPLRFVVVQHMIEHWVRVEVIGQPANYNSPADDVGEHVGRKCGKTVYSRLPSQR